MKTVSTKRMKRIMLWLVFVFIILFLFRLAYGYSKKHETINHISETNFFDGVNNFKRKNYASKKYELPLKSNIQIATKVDQKYEKIAEINTKSSRFEQDEKTLRKQIKNFNALIQFEQKSGNKGFRKLNVIIGVPPKYFDSLYHQLTKVGNVKAKRIIKKDKTNEYKELNAQKKSLEKILKSLTELKSKGGKIEEYMNLENRILEIENQLQKLGVSLGDFDDENEFCTVQFSLNEGILLKIGILQRIKVALQWTIKMYLRIILSLCFMILFSYISVLIIDKLKTFKK